MCRTSQTLFLWLWLLVWPIRVHAQSYSLTEQSSRCGQTFNPSDLPPLSFLTQTTAPLIWPPPGSGTTTSSSPSSTITTPPIIRATANDQPDCDIFGPLCQTGSITVGLASGKNGSASTTMACSSYLSAQYSMIKDYPWLDDYSDFNWMPNFGRSDQCEAFARGNDRALFDKCANSSMAYQEREKYFPRGVDTGKSLCDTNNTYGRQSCCGSCSMVVREIEVFYFPSENPAKCENGLNSTNHGNSSDGRNAPAQNTVASVTLGPGMTGRAEAITPRAAESTAVIDGYTYTSPSVYLKFLGNLYPSDHCGVVSPALETPTIAINPTDLSTISAELKEGQTWREDRQDFPVHTKQWNPDEMLCPTWGLSDRSSYPVIRPIGVQTKWVYYYTVGPPYHPVVLPPETIRSAAPEWQQTCFDFPPNQDYPYIFDPPKALTKQTGLGPNPGDPGTPITNPGNGNNPAPTPEPVDPPPAWQPTRQTGMIPQPSPSNPRPTDPSAGDSGDGPLPVTDPDQSDRPESPNKPRPAPQPNPGPVPGGSGGPGNHDDPNIGGIIESEFNKQFGPRPAAPGAVSPPEAETEAEPPGSDQGNVARPGRGQSFEEALQNLPHSNTAPGNEDSTPEDGTEPGGNPPLPPPAAGASLVPLTFTNAAGSPIVLAVPDTLTDELANLPTNIPPPSQGGTLASIAADGSLLITGNPPLPTNQAQVTGDVLVTLTGSAGPVVLTIPATLSDDISRIRDGPAMPTAGGKVIGISEDGELIFEQSASQTGVEGVLETGESGGGGGGGGDDSDDEDEDEDEGNGENDKGRANSNQGESGQDGERDGAVALERSSLLVAVHLVVLAFGGGVLWL